MRSPFIRLSTLAVVAAIAFAACGGGNATPAAVATASPSASTAAAATPTGPATVPPGGPVQIRWFCCLGGGDDEDTLKVFNDQIKAFNASHLNIKVVLDHTAYEGARQAFSVKLASGNPPDIVGPLG